jgi:hypothetical protein
MHVDDATAETADTTALVDGGGGATAISHARIAKVIKPRPYGLFLAKKGASLVSRTTTTQDGEGEGKYNSTWDGMGCSLLP